MATDSGVPYTTLGPTGVRVSRLCLGCMNFGLRADREQSVGVIERALDRGINFLDTADFYGHGESERFVGEAIDGRRGDVVLATKCGLSMGDGPNDEGLSRKHVIDAVAASLDRLDTDYIDLLQIHHPDEQTPITETLDALDWLIDEGKVRYVGASNLAAWQLTRALYEADRHDYRRFVTFQPPYSLVDRDIEDEILPACRAQNVGVIPYSPLAGGFLAGKYERDQADEEGRLYEWGDGPDSQYGEAEWRVLDAVRDVAADRAATPTQVSLAWMLQRDGITAPIVGPRTVDQLDDCLGAFDVSLTDAEVDRLSAPLDG